jgi:peptidoglycan hydrolase CwlO-like protein
MIVNSDKMPENIRKTKFISQEIEKISEEIKKFSGEIKKFSGEMKLISSEMKPISGEMETVFRDFSRKMYEETGNSILLITKS